MKHSKKTKRDLVLKAILGQLEPARREALTRFLPQHEKDSLKEVPELQQSTPLEEAFNGEALLEKVHWSWFLPTFKLYPESEQKLFLSALSPYAEKNLAKTLTLSTGQSEITALGKAFVKQMLIESLVGPEDHLLPAKFLPKSPMNRLLLLSKKELTHLIDNLALFDLAIEQRLIVETKILKKIYALLTADEKQILKDLGGHKEPFSLGKLGLDRWDGSEESLRTLMHKRGLIRLAAGLAGQDPDLIWHICHQLDIGRGSQLDKLYVHEPIQGVTDVIMEQIKELL